MEVFGNHHITIESRELVNLTVTIVIDQLRNAIATMHVDFAIDAFQAKSLKQARGDAFPGELLDVFLESTHGPDIAIPSRENSRVFIEEIKATEAQVGLPRIVRRKTNLIDRPR